MQTILVEQKGLLGLAVPLLGDAPDLTDEIFEALLHTSRHAVDILRGIADTRKVHADFFVTHFTLSRPSSGAAASNLDDGRSDIVEIALGSPQLVQLLQFSVTEALETVVQQGRHRLEAVANLPDVLG